ncbi:hypothetical protein N2152v2_006523 [Parachlorella kessleri]
MGEQLALGAFGCWPAYQVRLLSTLHRAAAPTMVTAAIDSSVKGGISAGIKRTILMLQEASIVSIGVGFAEDEGLSDVAYIKVTALQVQRRAEPPQASRPNSIYNYKQSRSSGRMGISSKNSAMLGADRKLYSTATRGIYMPQHHQPAA